MNYFIVQAGKFSDGLPLFFCLLTAVFLKEYFQGRLKPCRAGRYPSAGQPPALA
ncbi:hypothetical protein LVJ83_07140 [Uruburuella testudinis]|uniref:Uncharacterized protein n=1 Tax=Uruburuella testudinis TaxID=1282863 RepID=A0ABY4DNY4_9NEIS|nr:hypothetical protein [Uruburuella testudinis]UOO80765.1 hypothetical protein LVJ83_07140 [Uruburuella testudinis]